MHSQRELFDLVYRNSFVAFAYKGFAALDSPADASSNHSARRELQCWDRAN